MAVGASAGPAGAAAGGAPPPPAPLAMSAPLVVAVGTGAGASAVTADAVLARALDALPAPAAVAIAAGRARELTSTHPRAQRQAQQRLRAPGRLTLSEPITLAVGGGGGSRTSGGVEVSASTDAAAAADAHALSDAGADTGGEASVGVGAGTGADKAGGEGIVGSSPRTAARARASTRAARVSLQLHEAYPAVGEALERWLEAGRRGEAGEGKYARSRELDELRIALVCAERDWRDGGGIPLHAYEEDIADPEGREQAAARRLVTLQEPLRAYLPGGTRGDLADVLLGRAARAGRKVPRPLALVQDLLGATVDLGGALAAAMEEAGQ